MGLITCFPFLSESKRQRDLSMLFHPFNFTWMNLLSKGFQIVPKLALMKANYYLHLQSVVYCTEIPKPHEMVAVNIFSIFASVTFCMFLSSDGCCFQNDSIVWQQQSQTQFH